MSHNKSLDWRGLEFRHLDWGSLYVLNSSNIHLAKIDWWVEDSPSSREHKNKGVLSHGQNTGQNCSSKKKKKNPSVQRKETTTRKILVLGCWKPLSGPSIAFFSRRVFMSFQLSDLTNFNFAGNALEHRKSLLAESAAVLKFKIGATAQFFSLLIFFYGLSTNIEWASLRRDFTVGFRQFYRQYHISKILGHNPLPPFQALIII